MRYYWNINKYLNVLLEFSSNESINILDWCYSFVEAFEFYKHLLEEEHNSINKLLDTLTDEDLNINIADDETIGDRLKHMTWAEHLMSGYLYAKEEKDFDIEVITLNNLKGAFEVSKKRHMETIDNLSYDDLQKMWKSKKSGNEYSYKWLLYHFLEHLITHRGQVAMALRMNKNEKLSIRMDYDLQHPVKEFWDKLDENDI